MIEKLFTKTLNHTYNSIDIDKLKEYCLIVGYFASLFSATCFFFDSHKTNIFDFTLQLPIGLTFFPLTFALSNILQDKFGRRAANSLILTAFIFDTLLVFGGLFLAYIGDRQDYWTVFKDMPHIMIATWFFLGIGSIFNIALYTYLGKTEPKGLIGMLFRFFLTITATELLTSMMSMPLMFYKHGLTGSIALTIIAIVIYKVLANMVITSIYGIIARK